MTLDGEAFDEIYLAGHRVRQTAEELSLIWRDMGEAIANLVEGRGDPDALPQINARMNEATTRAGAELDDFVTALRKQGLAE